MLQIGTGKGRGRRALGYIVFLTAAWIALSAVSLHRLPAGEFFWLTLLYISCSLPTVLFAGGHPFRIPLMPMWGLVYFVMFGMPMLSEDFLNGLDFLVPETAVVNALRLAALGAGTCLLTFYTPLGRWVERVVPRIKAPWDPDRAPLLGMLLTTVGLGTHYYTLVFSPPPSLAQFLSIVSQLATIGIVTLFLLQLRGRLSLILKLFIWGLAIPLEFLISLGTGFIYEVIRSLAPLLFCYAAERRRIPWQALAIGILCLLPLAGSVKQEFRSIAWYGESGDIDVPSSPIQRGLAFVGLATKQMGEGRGEAYSASMESAKSRIGHLGVFMITMEMTPTMIPFWKGETYFDLFWALAPRILFPGKPTKTVGQAFGHRYNLLDLEDESTSFNLPHQVIEPYVNFGSLGVILGMAIVGWIYRALIVLLGHPEAGERGTIIGCTLFSNMLIIENSFSLAFGGLVYYLLIMYFFIRFLQPRSLETLPSVQPS
ncbi:MAG: hypothetical protein HY211_04310 [Candidatus Omnitrophica bacterium]|nr:hypothetical protein [Candidatus Omnitrophota bacterium]